VTDAYTGSLDHVLAEVERLDLLLSAQVHRMRPRPDGNGESNGDGDGAHGDGGADRGLAALYVTDAEIDELLASPIGAAPWAGAGLPPEVLGPLQDRLDEMADDIGRRVQAALADGVPLRLVLLAHLFGLAAFDVDVVLVCLAPEIDRRYERLFAYLHDDLSRRRPSVDLVLHLLCPELPARVAARSRFGAAAPLVRHRLVELSGEPGPGRASLLGQSLVLDPRIARFLLGDDELDDRLLPLVRRVVPATAPDQLVFPAAFRPRVDRLVAQARDDGDHLVLYLQGPYGVGKRSTAEACCRAIGAELLVVDGKRLADRGVDEFEALARLVDREARLQGAMLYLDGFDALLAPEREAHLATLLPLLDAHPGPTFLSGSRAWEPQGTLRATAYVRVELPPPGAGERLALWRSALEVAAGATGVDADADATTDTADAAGDGRDGPGGLAADVDLPALANTFRLTGGQIVDAAATARNLALARADGGPEVTRADLHAACRLQSNRKLAELAQKITPQHSWDDLVLPPDHLAQLREVHNHVRLRALVHDTWGFDGKLALGKGLNVLFAGPPGTGKTMAADVLGHTLGLDLYKIDLGQVMSKYIGETEKNLGRLFDEARTSNAILFFDEADALFGKRTAVRDAHDRYANVEVSYLLQRMEDYDGLVILASNLRKNMDEAFVRRLHFTLEFPMPGVDDRRRIWERIWPAPAPLDPALDLDALARDVPVSGGAIRNIALAGAFLAAADGGTVTMEHLVHATRREYQKMGKVLTAGELAVTERKGA
jgi:ATP-dependent 26S proteasome regulatory subunit